MKLVVATRNPGKLREIREFLSREGIEVLGLDEIEGAPRVEEDGETFLQNARKKARTLSEATGLPVLADDSGLTVEALGGAPGVLSARYAGERSSDRDNIRKLLGELRGTPVEKRAGAFVCTMVLIPPGGGETVAEGRLEGRILEDLRGSGGFGYDPVFYVESEGCTLAELDLERKNRLSHRGRALRALLPSVLELVRHP